MIPVNKGCADDMVEAVYAMNSLRKRTFLIRQQARCHVLKSHGRDRSYRCHQCKVLDHML